MSWAAVAAMLARIVQSLYFDGTETQARLQVYVDDPILGLRGSPRQRKRIAVKFVSTFLILGFQMAFAKAQLNHTVVWIGVEIQVKPWEILISLPLSKLQELEQIILEMLSHNIVTVKLLRSFAGKCSNVATVLYVWRPFLSQLWAALAARDAELTNAPSNCVWTKQIETSLCWIQSFIRGQTGAITRTYSFSAFFGAKSPVEVTTDSSIWGIGGFISLNGVPLAYFADVITPEDEHMLNLKRGEPEGQQVFEGLSSFGGCSVVGTFVALP